MEALRTKAAIGLAAFSLGGPAVEAVPAFGNEAGPQANTATDVFNWSVVGGNPFKEGGVQTKSEVRVLIASSEGHTALHQMGFENNDIKALEKGTIKSCHIAPNVVLKGMVSGGGDFEKRAKLDGKKYPDGIPAFCVTAVHTYKKHGKLVKEKDTVQIAKTCANITNAHEVVKVKKAPKKTAPVRVTKVAENNEGKVIPTPTNTFEFEVECTRPNGKKVERKVMYMHARQMLSRLCKVGGMVSVEELPAHANEEWELISPNKPKQFARLSRKGLKFVFKNREKAPKQPQPKCEDTMTPEQCHPKTDGPQGPGTGTPGNTNSGSTVGGPGAGGQPGNTSEGIPCYDDASTTNGDQNPATSGETLYGKSSDQMGYCVGPAQPMQSA
jgi:hypothetical protein